MAGLTPFSNLSPEVQGYYDTKALIRAKKICVTLNLAQKKQLPLGKGSTVNFYRYKPLAVNTTALTEATDGGISLASRQQFQTQEVSVTPSLWGDYAVVGKLASMTKIDQGDEEQIDVVTQQAFESLDRVLQARLGVGLQRLRADLDGNYQVQGTTTGAGTTTTVVDATNLTQADSYWVGGWVTITDPTSAAYGQTRLITGFANSTGTITVGTAFSAAPGSGVTYSVCVGTGITTNANINGKALRYAVKNLRNNKAMRFEKSMFKCLLDPDLAFDFFEDPDFKRAGTDKDRTDYLETNEVGRWAGVLFAETTEMYRESVAGVYSQTADVHVVPIVGKESFGAVDLGNMAGSKEKNFKIYVRNWEQLGQPIPYYNTIGYQAAFEAAVLNGCFGIGLMCGATK